MEEKKWNRQIKWRNEHNGGGLMKVVEEMAKTESV